MLRRYLWEEGGVILLADEFIGAGFLPRIVTCMCAEHFGSTSVERVATGVVSRDDISVPVAREGVADVGELGFSFEVTRSTSASRSGEPAGHCKTPLGRL